MVKAALSHGEVAVFYQPQYDVASGAMTGVEALLRWRHPELGLLGAGPLVTAARAARLEPELPEHAHRISPPTIVAWPHTLAALRVLLNITRDDLGAYIGQSSSWDSACMFGSISAVALTIKTK